jgi:hypothetical protein
MFFWKWKADPCEREDKQERTNAHGYDSCQLQYFKQCLPIPSVKEGKLPPNM